MQHLRSLRRRSKELIGVVTDTIVTVDARLAFAFRCIPSTGLADEHVVERRPDNNSTHPCISAAIELLSSAYPLGTQYRESLRTIKSGMMKLSGKGICDGRTPKKA
jgi:hypothetical protein